MPTLVHATATMSRTVTQHAPTRRGKKKRKVEGAGAAIDTHASKWRQATGEVYPTQETEYLEPDD